MGKFRILKKYEVVAQRGGGLVEVLLAMVIIAVATPFTYSMISDTTHTIHDMAIAHDIISLRDGVLNFVRINEDLWPEVAQIKMSDEELRELSESISAGFIDKYEITGGNIVDVYLAFDLKTNAKRVARIAKNVGADAAVVGPDGIAYGDIWAVTAPDFKVGNLVYRITRNKNDFDTTRFLHRGTSDDGLNMMLRDLNMGNHDIYNVGGINGDLLKVRNLDTTFVNAKMIDAKNVYFSSGANMNGDNTTIGALRVSGDINGFRSIEAKKLSGSGIDLNGHVIADRATVNDVINVSNNFVLKSTSLKVISGFAGITTGTVYTPYLSAGELMFAGSYGLTVSGELLVSSTPPIKFGTWSFPSKTPPLFTSLTLARAPMPRIPVLNEFGILATSNWKME